MEAAVAAAASSSTSIIMDPAGQKGTALSTTTDDQSSRRSFLLGNNNNDDDMITMNWSRKNWPYSSSSVPHDHQGPAHKIEQMLSRAINDQQELWKILVSSTTMSSNSDRPLRAGGRSSEDADDDQLGEISVADGVQIQEADDDDDQQKLGVADEMYNRRRQQQQQVAGGGSSSSEFYIPAMLFKPLAAKLENSLDWCYLALCRIQDFTSQITAYAARSAPAAPCRPSSLQQPIIVDHQQVMSCMPAAAACRYPPTLLQQTGQLDVRDSYCTSHDPCTNVVSKLKLQHASSLSALQIPGRSTTTAGMDLSKSSSLLQQAACSLDEEASSFAAAPSTPMSSSLLCFGLGNNYSAREKTSTRSLAYRNPSGDDDDQAGVEHESAQIVMLASDMEPSTQGQNFDHGRIFAALAGTMQQDAAAAAATEYCHRYLQADSDHMAGIFATASIDDDDHHHDSKDNLVLMTRAQLASKALNLRRSSSCNHRCKNMADEHDDQLQFISPSQNINDHHDREYTHEAAAAHGNIMQQFKRSDSFDGRLSMTSTVRKVPGSDIRDKEAATVCNDEAVVMSTEERKSVVVVYQRLRPGAVDNRKGIPADGHRRWKKYGNKSIQNANFCRGYYKCSVKECNAKKMVQPTDKDPTVFQVTYMGTHTCSSSTNNYNLHKKKKQRTGNYINYNYHVQLGDRPAAAAAASCQELGEQDQTSPAATAAVAGTSITKVELEDQDQNNVNIASIKDAAAASRIAAQDLNAPAASTEEADQAAKVKVRACPIAAVPYAQYFLDEHVVQNNENLF